MKDYEQRWNVNTMKDVMYIHVNDLQHNELKEIKQETIQ